ncbi:hypothetical protein Tco_0992415 [Tanacetum coccineum]|uniref:Uncharacterized protein n=1 Tax=Tanacetum coccineum TaxID=301880 RepID=A0ABQ5F212_9ASTR
MTLINAEVLSNFVSLQCLSSLLNTLLQNTMAEQNVPTQPPTRTDEQIVPRSQWLTIGKSNLLFNAQKIQKNPIFQISVDILSNTNFFQAFTASANVPAIYLQQFWNTMKYNEKTGVYSCQVDEQWFDLSADLLRKALAITPVNPTHPFELPPSGDTVIDFVNELGYPEPVEIVSSIRVNYVYQPWRAILSLLNQADMGRVYSRDPDIFLTQRGHKASLKTKGKVTPLPSSLMDGFQSDIYYLASNNNIHRRPDSAVHHTGDDYVLGNLKFVPKGESVEVFGMAIPDPLITEAYNNLILLRIKQTKPAPPPTKKLSKRKLPQKVRKGKHAFQLVDEEDEAQQESIPQREDDDPDLDLAKKLSLEVIHEIRRRKKKKRTTDQFILVRRDQTPPDSTTGPSSQPDDDTSEKVIHESSSTSDSERTESETEVTAPKGDKDQDEVDTSTVTSGEKSKAREESDSTIPDPSHQTVTSTPPVIAPFTDVSSSKPSLLLRVARLEQEMSEVKKTDLSADVLASIRSQVPTAVDNYLGTKLDDALLKSLSRIRSEQESEGRIIKAKRIQGEEKQDFNLLIRPFSGSNQGRSTKRRRFDSAASGQSASKPNINLPSTGWQITDTREAGVDSSMHRSDPESEHSKQSSDDISKQDKGNDSDMEDTDNTHIPKVSTTTIRHSLNDFPEPEHNGKMHTPQRLKFWRKQAFKGRRMILGIHQTGSAAETGKKEALHSSI